MAYWGEVDIIQNSQSISGNSSNVTVNYYACSDVGSAWGNYTTYPYLGLYCSTLEYTETQTFSSGFNFGNNKRIKIGSITKDIPHNADGTMSVSASFTWNSNHSLIGTVTGSGSKVLTTIARASTPTVTGTLQLGGEISIATNRASSSFTHKLYYSFGSIKNSNFATGVTTSRTWTIPKDLANQIPYATSGTLSILCETYNGSTYIGAKTISITVSVPNTAEFKPSVTGIAVSEAVSGLNGQFGAFIQNKSKVACTITATGAYSSTIKTYKVTINGATYSSKTFTTGFLKTAGNNTVSVTVTDTRGRTATSSTTITVLAYTDPTITKLIANRCLEDGTLDDEGSYAKVEIAATITSLNSKNTYSYTFQYRDTDDNQYTNYDANLTAETTTTEIKLSGSVIIPADEDNSFEYMFVISDYFNSNNINKLAGVETVFQLINFNASGKGLAFGKVSEKEAFEVAMDTEITKNLVVQDMNILNEINNAKNIDIIGKYETGNIDPNTTLYNLILTNNANGPAGDGTTFYYIRTMFYKQIGVDVNRTQIAYGYRSKQIATRYYYNGTWSTWRQYGITRTQVYSTEVVTPTNGSWQYMCNNDFVFNLAAGEYYCVMSFAIAGLGNGIATVRPMINNSELNNAHRSTVPIANSLMSSGQVNFYISPSAGACHFNAQIYTNVNVNIQTVYLEIYRIG